MSTRSTTSALGLVLTLLIAPGAAWAAEGFARSSSSLRAGPGSDYPRIARVASGESLEIFGCLRRATWCDVSADGERGWFPGSRIDFLQSGRRARLSSDGAMFGLSVLTFGIGDYWGAHYGSRPWVNDRRWRGGPRGDRGPVVDSTQPQHKPGPPSGITGDGRPPAATAPVERPPTQASPTREPPAVRRPDAAARPNPAPLMPRDGATMSGQAPKDMARPQDRPRPATGGAPELLRTPGQPE